MAILKYIRNLFSEKNNVDAYSPISKEDKRNFSARFNDLGQFAFSDDGFTVQLKSEQQKIKWADIERLVAYKHDLFTSDEICLDIVFNNHEITISEETPGWYQFVERIKITYPEVPQNWDTEIVHPPFATNLTVLYQRKDRVMPEYNNFFASFNNTSKVAVKGLLEKNGWQTRNTNRLDFELFNSWSEILLEGEENAPLLNGRVAFHTDNIVFLDHLFNALGGQYAYEFYDKDKNLIAGKK